MKFERESTDKVRNSYNYRYHFMKENKGLFGSDYYVCGYCGRIVHKSNMQVDHVIPLKKYGVNKTYNCIAACSRCNQQKGKEIDGWLCRGVFAKLIQSTHISILLVLLSLICYLFRFVRCIYRIIKRIIFR